MTKLTEKQQHWTAIIKAWSESGSSQSDYCKQNNIDLKRFYHWKNTLGSKKNPSVTKGTFIAVEPKLTVDDTIRVTVQGAEVDYNPNTDESLFLQCIALLRRTK